LAKGDIEGSIIYRDRASAVLDKVSGKAEKAGGKFGGMGAAAKAGGLVAGVALFKFAKSSVSAFTDAEQSQASLDLALKKFPKTADVTRASFDKLNSAIERKTKFDDDALAAGQSVLAQFDLTGKQIQGLTPLLADYATKTGKDLPTAATDLGKAFGGNLKALKNLGISYKMTGDKAKDQAAITDLLQQKVGGAAEAMGKTASGKAAILSNQFGELQEKVGSKLVPALTKLADIGLKVVDFISRNSSVILPLVAVVGTLIAGIKIWTMAQAALNVVMAMNPIGLVVIAIAALVAGLVLAYKKSETFRNIVHGAMHGVAAAVDFVKDHWKAFATVLAFLIGGPIIGAIVLLVTHFGKIKSAATTVVHWVTDKFSALVGFITGLPAKIGHAASGMFDGIKNAFRSAVNWIVGKWNDLHFTIGGGTVLGKHLPSVTLNTPNIPMLAAGGIVPATPGGRIVRVAEAGQDEAIIPLPRGGRSSGGMSVSVVIQAGIGDPIAIGREVRKVLARYTQETGFA
jgi:phage-related protein